METLLPGVFGLKWTISAAISIYTQFLLVLELFLLVVLLPGGNYTHVCDVSYARANVWSL